MRIRTALISASLFGVALVSGCGTSTSTQTALPDSHQTYSEYLVLKGQLRGNADRRHKCAGRSACTAGSRRTPQDDTAAAKVVPRSWQRPGPMVLANDMLLAFAVGQYLWLSRSEFRASRIRVACTGSCY